MEGGALSLKKGRLLMWYRESCEIEKTHFLTPDFFSLFFVAKALKKEAVLIFFYSIRGWGGLQIPFGFSAQEVSGLFFYTVSVCFTLGPSHGCSVTKP